MLRGLAVEFQNIARNMSAGYELREREAGYIPERAAAGGEDCLGRAMSDIRNAPRL